MNIIYWSSTLLICLFLAASVYSFIFSKPAIEGFQELGLPDYFRIELIILKLIAIAVLTIPSIPSFVKDWGYAGIGLFLITALIAHIVHKDGFGISIMLILLLIVLIVSRYTLPESLG